MVSSDFGHRVREIKDIDGYLKLLAEILQSPDPFARWATTFVQAIGSCKDFKSACRLQCHAKEAFCHFPYFNKDEWADLVKLQLQCLMISLVSTPDEAVLAFTKVYEQPMNISISGFLRILGASRLATSAWREIPSVDNCPPKLKEAVEAHLDNSVSVS